MSRRGAAAMGQSTKTMLAQIVAEELGGDVDNLVITTGDTAAIELGMGGFNSRQAVMAGASAHAAAKNVREKALTVASAMLDVGEQALEIEGDRVRVRGERRAVRSRWAKSRGPSRACPAITFPAACRRGLRPPSASSSTT